MNQSTHSRLKLRSLGLALLLAATLAGCGQEAEMLAQETIAEVVSYKDPTVALEKLREAEIALSQICAGSGADCAGPVAQLIEAQRRIVGEAVKLGDTNVIREVFNRGSLMSMQQELAPIVLGMAQHSTDPNIMASVAKIFGDGQVVPQDTNAQVDYLAKAWRLGDVQSSGELAALMEKAGDYQNAYLWSLRCFGECRRQQIIELAILERRLGIAKIEAIQALAANRNVTTVDRNL